MIMNKLLTLFTLLCSLLLFTVTASAQPQDPSWAESCDPRLQKALETRLNTLHLDRATQRKLLSIVVVDITDVSDPRMAYINPNEMMYAAFLQYSGLRDAEPCGYRLFGRTAAVSPLPAV
jgi:beta-lactamase class A